MGAKPILNIVWTKPIMLGQSQVCFKQSQVLLGRSQCCVRYDLHVHLAQELGGSSSRPHFQCIGRIGSGPACGGEGIRVSEE